MIYFDIFSNNKGGPNGKSKENEAIEPVSGTAGYRHPGSFYLPFQG